MPNIAPSDFEAYCPVCTRCVDADPQACPDCLSPRPAGGWQDLGTTSYGYLGKILDDRYVVDRFVGAGSTGDVYRGVGMRIARPFALKIVDTRRYAGKDIQQEMTRRLELEVEVMSRLNNPHVISVYESLKLGEAVFVLVMDYVEGVTLQERLERTGRLDPAEAVEIVRQIANGLHEAHQRGIIHRDLKPENIMIEEMPARGIFARLLDFGVVYMVDSVRQTSGFRGTPLYASPEQCRSNSDIDARSDVYSLGCVLFDCLAGRPPFEADRSMVVMEAHLEEPVPSIYDVIGNDDLPASLDRLLNDMLAKHPDQRPADCGEIIGRLDAIADDLAAGSAAGAPPADPAHTASRAGAAGSTLLGTNGPNSDVLNSTSAPLAPSSAEHRRVVHLVDSLDLPETISSAPGGITASALGPGGDYAVLADRQFQVHMVGLKSHLASMQFRGSDGLLTALSIDPNRGDIYAGGFDSKILSWNFDRTLGLPSQKEDLGERILALDIDATGNRLLVGTERGQSLLYDLRTGQCRQLYRVSSPVSVVRFIPATDYILIGSWEGDLQIVEMSSKQVVTTLEPLDSPPITASIDDAGEVAAIVEESGQLRICRLANRQAYLRVEASFANLTALSYGEDGQLTGLGVTADHLQLWIVRHDKIARHLSEKNSAVLA